MNRWWQKAVSLLAAVLLAGCATYSQPRYYEPGRYYTGSYTGHYGYSFGYSSAYYPWWSVDHFYLGLRYGHPLHYGHVPSYGHYDHRRYYPGYPWGWSYWRPFPYYGYGAYDPWWRYRYGSYVYRPSGRHDGHEDHADDHPPAGTDRSSMTRPGHRAGIVPGERDRKTVRRERTRPPERATLTERRGIPATPRRADERGMVVTGGGDNKIRPSRHEPIGRVQVQPRPAVTVAPPQKTTRPGVVVPPPSTGGSYGRRSISAPPRETMSSTVQPRKPARGDGARARPPRRALSVGRDDDGNGKGRYLERRARDYR